MHILYPIEFEKEELANIILSIGGKKGVTIYFLEKLVFHYSKMDLDKRPNTMVYMTQKQWEKLSLHVAEFMDFKNPVHENSFIKIVDLLDRIKY